MSTRKNIFKKLWASLKPAVLRFPALFALGLLAAVCLSLKTSAWKLFSTADADIVCDSLQWHEIIARREVFEARMLSFILPAAWGMVISVLLGLLYEPLPKERAGRALPGIVQGAVFVLSLFPASLFFATVTSLTWIVFWGVLLALSAACAFILMRQYGTELVVPNCIIAGIIAGIACGCVMAGLNLIYLAVKQLLVKIPEPADTVIGCLLNFIPCLVLFTGLFVAYTTKPKEDIAVPKAYRAIMLYMLLPLYVMLVAVLYCYLLKSLVMRTMPSGKINSFVSCASAGYVFFLFATAMYKTRFTDLFKKAGPFVLLPLLVTQCIAFALRVSAYGYTQARVASLLYILFSTGCLVLCIIGNDCKKDFGRYIPAILALFLLAGSITPLNIKASAERSQTARIFRIYRSHGMADVANGVGLSEQEKAAIVDAWLTLSPKESRYPWAERARYETKDVVYRIEKGSLVTKAVIKYDFEKLFGFAYSREYGKAHGYTLAYRTDSASKPLDVSRFSSVWRLLPVSQEYYDVAWREPEDAATPESPNAERKIIVGYGERLPDGGYEHSYDITAEIRSHLKRMDWNEALGKIEDAPCGEERLFLSMPDGTTLVLTEVYLEEEYDADGKRTRYGTSYVSIGGYACR